MFCCVLLVCAVHGAVLVLRGAAEVYDASILEMVVCRTHCLFAANPLFLFLVPSLCALLSRHYGLDEAPLDCTVCTVPVGLIESCSVQYPSLPNEYSLRGASCGCPLTHLLSGSVQHSSGWLARIMLMLESAFSPLFCMGWSSTALCVRLLGVGHAPGFVAACRRQVCCRQTCWRRPPGAIDLFLAVGRLQPPLRECT